MRTTGSGQVCPISTWRWRVCERARWRANAWQRGMLIARVPCCENCTTNSVVMGKKKGVGEESEFMLEATHGCGDTRDMPC